jgi:hypothetical protein
MQLYIVHNSNNDNNSNTSQLLFVGCAKTVSNSLADPLKLREGSRAWPKFARCTARGRHRFRQILSHYLQLARDIALYYYVQMHNNMQVARVRWVTLLLSVLLLLSRAPSCTEHAIYMYNNVQNCMYYSAKRQTFVVCVCVYCIYRVITDAALVPVIYCTRVIWNSVLSDVGWRSVLLLASAGARRDLASATRGVY